MFLALKEIDSWGQYGHGGSHSRYDDTSLSAFVENELDEVIPEMYDTLYEDLDAKMHIPPRAGIHPAVLSWSYDSMEKRGKAKIMGSNASDMPRADIAKKRVTNNIRTQILAYGWSMEEIENAARLGLQLERGKAEATRRGQAELEHDILLLGDVNFKLPGLLTDVRTPRVAVPNGGWLVPATPDAILADMNAVTDQLYVLSSRKHRGNRMLLPVAHERHIFNIARGTTTDTTIGEFYLRNNRHVKVIEALDEMETIGPGASASMLVYEMDPRNLGAVLPLPFMQLDPQVRGFEVLIPTRLRNGGTVWFYPFAGTFGDGI